MLAFKIFSSFVDSFYLPDLLPWNTFSSTTEINQIITLIIVSELPKSDKERIVDKLKLNRFYSNAQRMLCIYSINPQKAFCKFISFNVG